CWWTSNGPRCSFGSSFSSVATWARQTAGFSSLTSVVSSVFLSVYFGTSCFNHGLYSRSVSEKESEKYTGTIWAPSSSIKSESDSVSVSDSDSVDSSLSADSIPMGFLLVHITGTVTVVVFPVTDNFPCFQ